MAGRNWVFGFLGFALGALWSRLEAVEVESVRVSYPVAFELRTHDCKRLMPGDSCRALIRYAPRAAGGRSAFLEVQASDGSDLVVPRWGDALEVVWEGSFLDAPPAAPPAAPPVRRAGGISAPPGMRKALLTWNVPHPMLPVVRAIRIEVLAEAVGCLETVQSASVPREQAEPLKKWKEAPPFAGVPRPDKGPANLSRRLAVPLANRQDARLGVCGAHFAPGDTAPSFGDRIP